MYGSSMSSGTQCNVVMSVMHNAFHSRNLILCVQVVVHTGLVLADLMLVGRHTITEVLVNNR